MVKTNAEIVKAGETNIVVADDENPNQVPYLFNLDKIEKPNCKLCQSELREKAEEIYDNQKRKNYAEIQRKLKDEDDFEINPMSIKNHMIYHHVAVQNNETLQDYADDLQRWVNMQTSRPAALKSRIAIMEREMFKIAQTGEEVDIIERRKNAETVKKLAETILSYEDKLSEYVEEVKPVNLVFNQLRIIVNDELAHVENVKTKKVVSTILNRLHDKIGDMII